MRRKRGLGWRTGSYEYRSAHRHDVATRARRVGLDRQGVAGLRVQRDAWQRIKEIGHTDAE